MESSTEALETFAVKTYRYLRCAIVVIVLSVIAAVLLERRRVGCFEGSISAYYYTPAQSLFVGGLVGIGVCLIAIKGSTDWEDVLLNLAGVLAPIVAFVPTKPPGDAACSPVKVILENPKLYVDNNVVAFAIGGGLALLIGYVVARLTRTPTIQEVDPRSRIILLVAAVVFAVGLIWYVWFREHFLDNAHFGTAIAMFAVVDVVIILHAVHRRTMGKPCLAYASLAAAMPLALVVLASIKVVDKNWGHFVFWLELAELGVFLVYWTCQTFEHWDGGVPTGAERSLASP